MKQTFRLFIFLDNCKKSVSVSKAVKMCSWDTDVSSFRHTPRSGFILNSLYSCIVFRDGYSTVCPQQYFSKVACPYAPTFVTLRAAFCLWHLMCMLFSAWVLRCVMIFHPLGFIFQACISFRGWVVFSCVSIGQFVYPCIVSGHSVCLQVLAAI